MNSEKPLRWRQRTTSILRIELSNQHWLGLIVAIFLMAALGLNLLRDHAEVIFWVCTPAALAALALAIRLANPRSRTIALWSLVLVALSLIIESQLLENAFFSPFTIPTKLGLWVTFSALALSLLEERLPRSVTVGLAPILAVGALLTLPFGLRIAPLMAFGWIAIPFAGAGLLTYSPILAAVAFVSSWHQVWKRLRDDGAQQHRRLMVVLSGLAVAVFAGVVLHLRLEVLKADRFGRARLESRSSPYSWWKDLPAWLLLAGGQEPTMAMQYLVANIDTDGLFSRSNGAVYDPWMHLATLGLEPWPLWTLGGDRWSRIQEDGLLPIALHSQQPALNVRASNGSVRVQLFPEQRVAYSEMELDLESSLTWNQVADLVVQIPEGSAATSLALWIDGKERPARLAPKDLATQAFNSIVHKNRDPALLEWKDERHLRLQVFPVSRSLPRHVKIGYVTPLDVWAFAPVGSRGTLEFAGPMLSGVETKNARALVTVEVFAHQKPEGLAGSLEFRALEAPAKDVFPFEASTLLGRNWTLKVPQVAELETSQTSVWTPKSVVLVPRGGHSAQEWLRVWRKLHDLAPGATLLLLDHHVTAISEENQIEKLLLAGEIQRGLPLPLYHPELPDLASTLFVVENDGAPSIFGLRDSNYFRNAGAALRQVQSPLHVLNLDQDKIAPFYISLALLNFSTFWQLDGAKLIQKPAKLSFDAAQAAGSRAAPFVGRLAANRHALRQLLLSASRRGIPEELRQELRSGQLVSPFSSLIVLESQQDYERFDIKDGESEANNSKPEKVDMQQKLGLVPEPHEYALMAICLLVAIYLHRRRTVGVMG